MVPSLSLTLSWDVLELPVLQQAIEAHADQYGWSPLLQTQVQLVTEEIVVNVMTHGHEGPRDTSEPGWVRIELHQDEDLITLVVTDNGAAFDPTRAPEPDLDLPLELRERGGLGVHFIRELAEHFSYLRLEGLNMVTIQKRREQQP